MLCLNGLKQIWDRKIIAGRQSFVMAVLFAVKGNFRTFYLVTIQISFHDSWDFFEIYVI